MMLTAATFWLSLAAAISIALLSPSTARDEQAADFPFRNTSLPWNERVDDLVSRLTLEEIQLQMARGGAGIVGGPAPAIPRLGILPYQWDTECISGAAQTKGEATGFPVPIGLAAMFSSDFMHTVAVAIGQEVRAKHNMFMKEEIYITHTGASCFSPVLNIARDPRWGRNQETYGEDPILTGELGKVFVQGLQGTHPRYVRASAGCKHFDVHGGPENIPVSRLSFNANVSEVDWRMTFLPAFKPCVDAGSYSVMCSYNRINGVPACVNKKLLIDILRKEWGFKGYVVSDEGAIEYIISKHKYIDTKVDTVAATVKAGCNLELSGNYSDAVYMHLEEAVQQGKLSEDLVRERLKPLFYTRMRLGEFDPPEGNPYAALGDEHVETPQHKQIAVEAAMKSYVLLKNQNSFLPLKKGQFKKVALIGPMSDNWRELFADYQANQPRNYTQTPYDALKLEFPGLKNGTACLDKKKPTQCKKYNAKVIPDTVKGAELVFVALGTGHKVEAEDRDRPDVELAGHQKDLLLDVIKNVGDNTKIVLLLFNAGPLNVTFADESPRVDAILECFFPGQGAGKALMNVLFNRGGNSSPAGRLPMTWPKYDWQIPPMVNYSMVGRTYRYFDKEALYPFGFGLSYTKFKYINLTVDTDHNSKTDLSLSVALGNIGDVDSDEVVQCYTSLASPQPYPSPRISLGFFTRVHVKAGQQVVVPAVLSRQSWAVWKNGQWDYQTGKMIVSCGGGQPGLRKEIGSISIAVNFHH